MIWISEKAEEVEINCHREARMERLFVASCQIHPRQLLSFDPLEVEESRLTCLEL